MNNAHRIYIGLISIATLYAIAKEREDSACNKPVYSVSKQCDEDSTPYITGTIPDQSDSAETLVKKIESALSFYEKGAVWRKCILLSNAYMFVVLMFTSNSTCMPIQHYVLMHLVFIAIMYFYFNYINYHYLRRLKANGTTAAELLLSRGSS